MTVPIINLDPDERIQENCCICRKPTLMWTELPDRTPGDQVALCERCAHHANPDEVPTKKLWLRHERISDMIAPRKSS